MTSTREALQSVVARLEDVIDQLPADPPEVPDQVEEWPENDEHLRGEFWKNGNCRSFGYFDGRWCVWEPRQRHWRGIGVPISAVAPFVRTTDPSQPRKFASLADIPEDVDRVAGKYLGHPCELARSPLSGTGWMMRVDAPYARQQWVEYMDLDEDDLTDLQEVIGHE